MKNIFFIALAILFCFSETVYAGDYDTGQTFNTIADNFQNIFLTFALKMSEGVQWLFSCLAVITLVWNFGQIALRGGQITEIFFSLIKTTLTVGFFWWLISDATTYIYGAIREFNNFAGFLTGSGELNPSEFISRGFQLTNKLFTNLNNLMQQCMENFSSAGFSEIASALVAVLGMLLFYIVGMFVWLLVNLMFIFTGFNMMMAMITFYFVAYFGFVLLGLAGSPYTRDMSMSYLKGLIGYGLTYYGMLICGQAGVKILDLLFNDSLRNFVVDTEASEPINVFLDILPVLFNMFVGSYAVYMLISKLPPMLGQLVSGAHFGGQIDAGAAAGSVTGSVVKGASGALGIGAGLATGGVSGVLSAVAQGKGSLSSIGANMIQNMLKKKAKNSASN